MRIITEKDKKGLLMAFRVFVRAMNGERMPSAAGLPVLEKALSEGLSFDEILNRGNWLRACAITTDLTAAEYVDILCERRIVVLPLKNEELWHDVEIGGFRTIAEGAHDFYQEVTGVGGKWNIPSSLTNLAKAIANHSLQAILSEKLINEVTSGNGETTYFDYIKAIALDFNSLPVDNTPTEAQEQRENESAFLAMQASGSVPFADLEMQESTEGESPESDPIAILSPPNPEDIPYPEMIPAAETSFIMPEPKEFKRRSVSAALLGYTPAELMGLVRVIEGGENLSLSEIIDALTDGRFNLDGEDPQTREIHHQINGDLYLSFLDCIKTQQVDIDTVDISGYDYLKDSWDLRDDRARRLGKLKSLVFRNNMDDTDLLNAIRDLEDLYAE